MLERGDRGRSLRQHPSATSANLQEHRQIEAATLDFRLKHSLASTPPDLVVVDPPRAGLGPGTTSALAAIGPLYEIVYVSCDPATLSRDLSALVQSATTSGQSRWWICFQTFHLESGIRARLQIAGLPAGMRNHVRRCHRAAANSTSVCGDVAFPIQCESSRTAGLFNRAGPLRGLLLRSWSTAVARTLSTTAVRIDGGVNSRDVVAFLAARLTPRIVLAPLGLAWIASGLFCAEIHPSPDPQTALLSYASNDAHAVRGEVVRAGPIRVVESTAPFAKRAVNEKSQMLDLRLKSLDGALVSGGLRLTTYAPVDKVFPGFRCGDQLTLTAPIHAPERYNDPGVWDSTAYLLGQGIGALASVKAAAVSVEVDPKHASFSCRLKAAQQAAGKRIMALATTAPAGSNTFQIPSFFRLTTEDASMLAAMITGDRIWLQRRTRVGFERTGSFHLLVVSGLHLAILPTHLLVSSADSSARFWASLITIGCALAYAFTGFGQPVQRSFWMVTLYLLARLLWRERSALNAIGFAALCLLAANPPSLFDAGFQMTASSVIAIAGIAIPLAETTLCILSSRHQKSFVARDRPVLVTKGGAVSRHPQVGNPLAAAHWQ